MEIFAISLLCFIVSAKALNPADFQVCDHTKPCDQLRGLIHYDAKMLSPYDRYTFRGRSWIIQPNGNQLASSITLVFKDFNINDRIFIITTSEHGTSWQKIDKNTPASFEVVTMNVSSLAIYAPQSESGRFQVYYYVGCTILTPGFDEIIFPTVNQVVGLTSSCWVVKPVQVLNRRRVYITMRDVYLIPGAQVTVEDLHSNLLMAQVNNTLQYDVFVADTQGSETILIDLTCGSGHGSCSDFGNFFSISYYTVTQEDVACIETQRQCALDSTMISPSVCRRTCPILEHIIDEEFHKEGEYVSYQKPILKSAFANANNEEESSGESDEKKEEEEEEEERKEEEDEQEEEQDARISKPTKPKQKAIKCQIKKKYCKCLRTEYDIRKYCFSKMRCKGFNFCAAACYLSRFILCPKIMAEQSISLFTGRG